MPRPTRLNLAGIPQHVTQWGNNRHGLQKGLPTGSDRFKRQIEEALFIKLSDGKRGRPKKTNAI